MEVEVTMKVKLCNKTVTLGEKIINIWIKSMIIISVLTSNFVFVVVVCLAFGNVKRMNVLDYVEHTVNHITQHLMEKVISSLESILSHLFDQPQKIHTSFRFESKLFNLFKKIGE